MSARAGVVGLGHIGRRLVAGLRAGGQTPLVMDVSADAVAALGDGVESRPTAASVAADADVVFIAVMNAVQVREAITGPEGLLAGAHPGSAIVVTSTVDLTTIRELAARCAEAGVVFADCGVTTVPGSADDAPKSVVAMLGVDDAGYPVVAPAVELVSRSAVHCGGPGAGMATKIARNVVTYGTWTVAAAASRLLAAAGFDDAGLRQAIAEADPDGRTLFMLEHEIGFDEATLAQRKRIDAFIEKDLGAALELARSDGAPVALIELVQRGRAELLRLAPERTLVGPRNEDESRYEYGRRWTDLVYGEGYHDANINHDGSPYNEETVAHLFGEIWSRPGLSLRERRLLVMGASAQLGRGDLIETQVYGGLENNEFSEAELREIILQLTPYIGWGKSSASNRGINAALARWKAKQEQERRGQGAEEERTS